MNFIVREWSELRQWADENVELSETHKKAIERLQELLLGELEPSKISRVAARLEVVNVNWRNQFLVNLAEKNDSKAVGGARVVDSYWLATCFFIGAVNHPEGRARIFAADLWLLFLLLLSFGRVDDARWLGGKVWGWDSVEGFREREDGEVVVEELREVSEWEALGGDVKGIGAVWAGLRRMIPGQREKEGSAGRRGDDEPEFPQWEEKALCGLVLRLWLLLDGVGVKDFPEGLPSAGVYEGLFANWDDEEGMRGAIVAACDYHLRRTEEDPAVEYDVAEFWARPYNVLPVEVLALRRVRAGMGLETPFPEHELLDSVFMENLPDVLPRSDDPLLERVVEKVREELPEVGKWWDKDFVE